MSGLGLGFKLGLELGLGSALGWLLPCYRGDESCMSRTCYWGDKPGTDLLGIPYPCQGKGIATLCCASYMALRRGEGVGVLVEVRVRVGVSIGVGLRLEQFFVGLRLG